MQRLLRGVLVAAACQASLGFSVPAPRCVESSAFAAPPVAAQWRPAGVSAARARARRAVDVRMAATAATGKKSRLLKAIKKPRGTIAIMAELKRKDPGTPDLEFPIPSIQVTRARPARVWGGLRRRRRGPVLTRGRACVPARRARQELSQCLNSAKVQSIAVWTDEQVCPGAARVRAGGRAACVLRASDLG
jgi:hypothetical protein